MVLFGQDTPEGTVTSTSTIIAGTDTVRAGLYQRVSTKDQNVVRQNRENREAAEERGWEASEYDEPRGRSASRFAHHTGRAEYAKLTADLAAGRLDVLVLWEVSRGDRRTARWAALLDVCQERGVLVHVTSKRKTYDPRLWDDRESLLRQGMQAEGESETLSDRITSGKKEGRIAGRPQGSIAYGVQRFWDHSKVRNAWDHDAPHPETGPVVARIIHAVIAGQGYQAIADALTAEGIPAPAGGRIWRAAAITRIAMNPAYVLAGVVTAEESRKARARVASTRQRKERAQSAPQRYSGCLVCATCRTAIYGTPSPTGPRYRCKRGHVSIPVPEVDAWIDTLAVHRLSQPNLADLVNAPESGADIAAAYEEIAGIRAQMREVARRVAAGRLTLDMAEEISAELGRKVTDAQRAIKATETPSALAGLPDTDRAVVRARWDTLPLAARRDALRALAPDAELRPGKRGHSEGGTGRHGGGTPVAERIVLWPGAK
jgi:DNA invertase Pin-like site-specific DNA recombinase